MPFIRTSYRQDRHNSVQLQAYAETLLESLVEHFQIPLDDFFHVFHAVEPAGFQFSPSYLDIKRSEELLFIEITLGSGRSRKQKRNFYQDAAERIAERCHIRPEDIFIILVETELEDWSFGLGKAQMIDTPPSWLSDPETILELKAHTEEQNTRNCRTGRLPDEKLSESMLENSAGQAYADISPAFADYTQRLLFDEVWADPSLTPRERSLVTLSALVTAGQSEQLPYHLHLAEKHGWSRDELSAVCTHLAFYAGWPRTASALKILEHELPKV